MIPEVLAQGMIKRGSTSVAAKMGRRAARTAIAIQGRFPPDQDGKCIADADGEGSPFC